MTEENIGMLRLASQRVTQPIDKPEEIVRHMVAMQAQDYSGSLWSVGVRMTNPSKTAVEQAIMDRLIIRTWPMRGTLHLLHADDAGWVRELLAPRATAAARSRRINQLGLTDEAVSEAESLVRHALKGGRSIVRGDVVTLLQSVKSISIDNQHTQHLMRNFGERGIICFGPNKGKQPTFVLLDEWIPSCAPKNRSDALKELAYRYFHSHGPATLKDFAGWGMMTIADAKFALDAARTSLEETEISGTVYFHAPGLTIDNQSGTTLLSGFDEFVLGYKDRSAIATYEQMQKIVPGGNGMFLPTVVARGKVIATWKPKVNAHSVGFTYDFFGGSAVATEASEQSYEKFLFS